MSEHLFVEIARPKVNLTLRILGRRPDGYHELASLVAFATGPADRVVLDCSRPRDITMTGPFAGGIAGVNLLDTAMALVTAAAQKDALRLGHVQLEKNLPVAAGVGAGSADAGALLRALRCANLESAETINWQGIALRLGADVPVCFTDRAAWMTGVGERLAPVEGLPRIYAVLVNPLVAVPADKTAQVFRALAASPLPLDADEQLPPGISSREKLLALINGGNDLERAACKVVPQISGVLEALRSTPGCRVAAMSGAGPTCFGVFDKAEDVAGQLAQVHPEWWVRAASLG
jgi:4-diphosphocytidyl-2-C-methyl-D-erythritol kinase